MKILCIQGSPRPKGNTAKVLAWVMAELRRLGHQVEHVSVGKGQIRPCRSCYGCKKTLDRPGCTIKDDGNAIFQRMIEADAVVLASPLYCWGISAQLKALVDRAFCLLKDEPGGKMKVLVTGKRLALVMTAGAEIEGNLDLAVPPIKAFAEFFQCRDAGALLIPFCTTPKEMGAKIEKQARAFARKVVA
jgi:multimeric flavodoxin WrbA